MPLQSEGLASELVRKLPTAALASLMMALPVANAALAADFVPPPTVEAQQQQQSVSFSSQVRACVQGCCCNLHHPCLGCSCSCCGVGVCCTLLDHTNPPCIRFWLPTVLCATSLSLIATCPLTPPPPRTPPTTPLHPQAPLAAPDVKVEGQYQLPEGGQWRYSEFINAVEAGKVERVRFSKDGSQLQLTAVDGRRATVVLPNDPDLVDILAKNGVDISVSEGEQQGNYVALLGNILFPLIAFGGLFFLFRRGQGGQGGGGMGPMGGAMDFGRSKSKFQEVPETGVTFADVAVSER